MSKPWEKEYQTHPMDMRVLVEKDPHGEGDGWLAVADLRVPLGECREVGTLFSAAPDMARALLEYRAQHGERCVCKACGLGRDALARAGVPLT